MRRVKEDFGKKDIFIDQDREIDSFFFYIETELQIREDYGIFMGLLAQKNR